MSEHRVAVEWKRETTDFEYETYSRNHTWEFEGGTRVQASAAPEFRGDAQRVDPEESFVASLSSCHMLTFLAIAARKRWTVDRYTDHARGTLEKDESGRLSMTRVHLAPRIIFSGDRVPTAEDIERVHDSAHRACFIANSVRTKIDIDGHLP